MAIRTGNVKTTKWKSCKAKVVLDQQNKFLRQSSEQTHALDPEKVLVEKSRSAIKRAAIETNASTNNIIAANIAGVTDNVFANLPRMDTMWRGDSVPPALHIHLFRTMATFYLISHSVLR